MNIYQHGDTIRAMEKIHAELQQTNKLLTTLIEMRPTVSIEHAENAERVLHESIALQCEEFPPVVVPLENVESVGHGDPDILKVWAPYHKEWHYLGKITGLTVEKDCMSFSVNEVNPAAAHMVELWAKGSDARVQVIYKNRVPKEISGSDENDGKYTVERKFELKGAHQKEIAIQQLKDAFCRFILKQKTADFPDEYGVQTSETQEEGRLILTVKIAPKEHDPK